MRSERPIYGGITFGALSDQSKLLPRKVRLVFLRHYNFLFIEGHSHKAQSNSLKVTVKTDVPCA